MGKTIFNMLPDVSGILLAAIGVALVVAPDVVSKLSIWIRWTVAAFLVLLGAAGLYSSFLQHRDDARDKSVLEKELGDVKAKLEAMGSKMEALFERPSEHSLPQHTKGLPSSRQEERPILVSATVINPHSLAIAVENKSDRPAEGITWEAVLYRESDLALLSFATQSIGYVKPHSKGSNYEMNLQNLPKLADGGDPEIKKGDVFTGSVSIDCPECKGATYIIHLVWDDSGWIYEVPNLDARLAITKDNSQQGRRQWIKMLNDLVPDSERIPIQQ